MKRIALLFIAAMLITAPAFAASSASTVYRSNEGKPGQATMQGNINQTNVKASEVINVGKDNTTKIGTMSNTGGYMTGNINQTEVTGSKVVNVGQGNTTEIGTMSNN